MDVPKTQFDIDHVEHSVGGLGGHAFRRITHVSMALIPVIYYSRGEEIADHAAPVVFLTFCFLFFLRELFPEHL